MLFYWDEIGIQIRILGKVFDTSLQESDDYFNIRNYESKIGAIVSKQSSVLESREYFVSEYLKYIDNIKKDNIDIQRPKNWGGYLLVPSKIEFWHDRKFRLHDRTIFTKNNDNATWLVKKLYP